MSKKNEINLSTDVHYEPLMISQKETPRASHGGILGISHYIIGGQGKKQTEFPSVTSLMVHTLFLKVSSSYHLCVECFSQLSFDSEVYTKSAAVSDFVYLHF